MAQTRGKAEVLAREVGDLGACGHTILTNLGHVTLSRRDSGSSSVKCRELNQMVSLANLTLNIYISKTLAITVYLHNHYL